MDCVYDLHCLIRPQIVAVTLSAYVPWELHSSCRHTEGELDPKNTVDAYQNEAA